MVYDSKVYHIVWYNIVWYFLRAKNPESMWSVGAYCQEHTHKTAQHLREGSRLERKQP